MSQSEFLPELWVTEVTAAFKCQLIANAGSIRPGMAWGVGSFRPKPRPPVYVPPTQPNYKWLDRLGHLIGTALLMAPLVLLGAWLWL